MEIRAGSLVFVGEIRLAFGVCSSDWSNKLYMA